jgi:hypothetical protein
LTQVIHYLSKPHRQLQTQSSVVVVVVVVAVVIVIAVLILQQNLFHKFVSLAIYQSPPVLDITCQYSRPDHKSTRSRHVFISDCQKQSIVSFWLSGMA